jgi:FtsP/CotA-like multicopper oxidase with cupredoxin domain
MVALLMVGFLTTPAHAKTSEYTLTIERLPVNITGKPIEKITVNGGIPAPTLRFTEGDEACLLYTSDAADDM